MQRRLLAVAIVDTVGYSRLMERDEARTHAQLTEISHNVVVPAVAAHGGRIVDRAGDGYLLEFQSATNALMCALRIQNEMSARQKSTPVHGRITFRIGVNVGDIIVDGEHIAGDVVNVAARLESIAEPGGICLSAAVRDQIREDLHVPVIDIGDVHVKNIDRPIHAFRIAKFDSRRSRISSIVQFLLNRRRPRQRALLAIVLALALAALGFGFYQRSLKTNPTDMSVAILPLSAESSAESKPADSLFQTITRTLTGIAWLRVVVTSAKVNEISATRNWRQLGQNLGVRYIVDGKLHTAGGRFVADIKLLDSRPAVAVWSKSFEFKIDEITEPTTAYRIAVQIRDAIYAAESKLFLKSGARPTIAMHYKMLGDEVVSAEVNSLEANRIARGFYEQALTIEPNSIPALLSYGYAREIELDLNPDVAHESTVQELDMLSRRIVALDPEGAPAWQFRAEALAREWRWEAALGASDKAVALDPSRAWAFTQRASLMLRLGKPYEAIQQTDRAFALSDQMPELAYFQRCRAQMALGEYSEAISACQEAIAREDWWFPHAYLAAAYALVDDDVRARRELALAREGRANLSIAALEALRYSDQPGFVAQQREHLFRGLRKIGIAEK